MYHRVCQIGQETAFLSGNQIPYEAMLERTDAGWRIVANDRVLAEYEPGGIRASVLWKAYCFRHQAEADAFTSGSDNLTPEMIVDLFQQDLKRRGVRIEAPADLSGRDRWSDVIRETYPAACY
jgi:hypothetical protein